MFSTPCMRVRSICILFVALAASMSTQAQTTQPAASDADRGSSLTDRKTLTDNWFGLGDLMAEHGVKFSLSYQSQFQQNFRGGANTHNAHDFSGSYDAVIKLDLEKIKVLDNAGIYFKFKGSYGEGIQADVGSLSRVNSDIGGDHAIFVKKWWFWHKPFDQKVEYRLGMLETNKDLYDVSLYANHEDKDFLNRASIRNSTVPHRTGIGAHVKVTPVDWLYAQAAVIDAQSQPRQTGFNTAFHEEAWFLVFSEFGLTPEYETAKGPMPGRYRAGVWYDPRPQDIYDEAFGTELPHTEGNEVGFYVGFDQMAWKENDDESDDQGLGLFCRYGFAHRDTHLVNHYWSAGASYKGALPERDRDVLGFAVSQLIVSDLYAEYVDRQADRETVYEWYYKYYLTPWCILSPDLQIITQPGGDKDDRTAVVGGLRLRVIF